MEPLEEFVNLLAQHIPGNDAELPVGHFSATRTQSRGVPSSVLPDGVQPDNKVNASKTAAFSSRGKSTTFGIRENFDLSLHKPWMEDERSCEVSWFAGILGTPTNLPCKASDDPFPDTGPMKQAWSGADFQDVGSCSRLAYLPLVDIRTTAKNDDWCVENDDDFFETKELTTHAMRAQTGVLALRSR